MYFDVSSNIATHPPFCSGLYSVVVFIQRSVDFPSGVLSLMLWNLLFSVWVLVHCFSRSFLRKPEVKVPGTPLGTACVFVNYTKVLIPVANPDLLFIKWGRQNYSGLSGFKLR